MTTSSVLMMVQRLVHDRLQKLRAAPETQREMPGDMFVERCVTEGRKLSSEWDSYAIWQAAESSNVYMVFPAAPGLDERTSECAESCPLLLQNMSLRRSLSTPVSMLTYV
jgi:hypothetical protein